MPAVYAFSYAPEFGANQPTPWFGLTERISQYGYQLWQAALSIVLFRQQGIRG